MDCEELQPVLAVYTAVLHLELLAPRMRMRPERMGMSPDRRWGGHLVNEAWSVHCGLEDQEAHCF